MLSVDEFLKIRLAHRDGMSVREIARRFGWSRQSVRKALAYAEPLVPRRAKPRASMLDALKPVVDAILTDDRRQPVKQRHTAMRIFERLRAEHGFTGGYDQVRRYVHRLGEVVRETFLPLVCDRGHRAECDFGHIYVDFPAGRKQVAVLIVTWAHSGLGFAIALPSERTEAILHGMTEAFDYFGCVPREVWWDNPRTVATAILEGRLRRLHERYQALASHYRFEPLFCRPAAGNEKPHVENRVKRLQRTWGTPIPCCADLAALNRHLRSCCEAERDRTVGQQIETIGVRFVQDKASALALPSRRFDPCLSRSAVADKYQTVRFETNWYSVPRSAAFAAVTLKVYVERIEIWQRDKLLARHERSYERGQQLLDPLHYLVTLERKPALLDHSTVYREWKLPEAFLRLRVALTERLGDRTGTRQFIRVLQLLGEHPRERIALAIEQCLARGTVDARIVAERAERIAKTATLESDRESTDATPLPEAVRQVAVAPADLSKFDRLFPEGDHCHV